MSNPTLTYCVNLISHHSTLIRDFLPETCNSHSFNGFSNFLFVPRNHAPFILVWWHCTLFWEDLVWPLLRDHPPPLVSQDFVPNPSSPPWHPMPWITCIISENLLTCQSAYISEHLLINYRDLLISIEMWQCTGFIYRKPRLTIDCISQCYFFFFSFFKWTKLHTLQFWMFKCPRKSWMVLKLSWRALVERQPLNPFHSSPAGLICLSLNVLIIFLRVLLCAFGSHFNGVHIL